MWANVFTLLCVFRSLEAVFMITLPSVEVEKKFKELGASKPYLLQSPNDASSMSTNLTDVEKLLHKQPTEAKNLVDLAESLNLTVLVKALEETGLDNIIDHEGSLICSCEMSIFYVKFFFQQESLLFLPQQMRLSTTSPSGPATSLSRNFSVSMWHVV